jgi:hypothetical protein
VCWSELNLPSRAAAGRPTTRSVWPASGTVVGPPPIWPSQDLQVSPDRSTLESFAQLLSLDPTVGLSVKLSISPSTTWEVRSS